MNVLERKMFVQKFQAGGDARLPITVIIEERKKRGLPVSLNDPEVVAQAEALQRGLPVSEIFQDQPFDIRYQANVQSMIDRGVPAQEIQAQFAQMGLPISLYQIQQMGGVSAPTVTQPPVVQDFSEEISQVSKPVRQKPQIGPNQIMVKGNLYDLPPDIVEQLDKGVLGGMDIFPLLNLGYTDDSSVVLGSNIDQIFVDYAKGDEPFGDLGQSDEAFRARLGYGKGTPEFGTGTAVVPEDFGSVAQLVGLKGLDLAKGLVKNIEAGRRYFGGAKAREEFLKNPVIGGINLDEGFDLDDLAEKRLTNIPGVSLVKTSEEMTAPSDDIDQSLEELRVSTAEQADIPETIVTAKRIDEEETPVEISVDMPTDPTKVTEEVIDTDVVEETVADETTPDTGEKAGVIDEEGKQKEFKKDTEKKKEKEEVARPRMSGLGLARFLSSLGAQSKAQNLSDLLSEGAATFAGLELAQAEKERQERSTFLNKLRELQVEAELDSSTGMLEPTLLKEMNVTRKQVNTTIKEYEGGQSAIEMMNSAIQLFNDAAAQGKKVTGLPGQFSIFIDKFNAFFGIDAPTSTAGKIQNFIDIVKQKNIKDILQESGKTISNVDRDILDKIFGGLDLTTKPDLVLKKLQESRGQLINSNLEKQRMLKQNIDFLQSPEFLNRGLQNFDYEQTLVEKILAADPSKIDETIFKDVTTSSRPSEVYDLSGNLKG